VDNVQLLKSLIISDQMKSDLPCDILKDVNIKELDTFLEPHELGKEINKIR